MSSIDTVFFREATLRICGSLELDTFLGESFQFIRERIPADKISLGYFDDTHNSIVMLAIVSDSGAQLLNVDIPDRGNSSVAIAYDRAELHPAAKPFIQKGLIDKDASLLTLRLALRGKILGAVVFIAKQTGQFTHRHTDLISLLREPFAVALSNIVIGSYSS